MSKTYEIVADARERVGKGSARALRREGKIPAVIYGDKQPPLSIAINAKDTFQQLHAGGFLTHVATVKVGSEAIRVLPRDYQLDPVTDMLVHVDFMRVSDATKLSVEVPVHIVNQENAPGLKRGGVLNIVTHEVALLVSASAIPEHVEVDVGALDFGDSVHASEVKLPAGASLVEHDDFVIATVTGVAAEEAPAAEAAAEPAKEA